jgi:hypothetical protein
MVWITDKEYTEWLESLDEKQRLIFSYCAVNVFKKNAINLLSFESLSDAWTDTNALTNQDFLTPEVRIKLTELEYLPLSQIIERIYAVTHNKTNRYEFFSLEITENDLVFDEEKERALIWEDFGCLSILKNLKSIDLSGLNISSYTGLAKLCNLEYIKFNKNESIDFEQLNNLPNLRELCFDYLNYPQATMAGIAKFKLWGQIEKLTLVGIHTLFDLHFLYHARRLNELQLVECEFNNIDTLRYLSSLKLLNLQAVNLQNSLSCDELQINNLECLLLEEYIWRDYSLKDCDLNRCFPNLKELHISLINTEDDEQSIAEQLNKALLSQISKSHSLRVMSLQNFTNFNFYYLSELTSLENLMLINWVVNDFDGVEYLRNLQILSLDQIQFEQHTRPELLLPLLYLEKLSDITIIDLPLNEIEVLKHLDSLKFLTVRNDIDPYFFSKFKNLDYCMYHENGKAVILDKTQFPCHGLLRSAAVPGIVMNQRN